MITGLCLDGSRFVDLVTSSTCLSSMPPKCDFLDLPAGATLTSAWHARLRSSFGIVEAADYLSMLTTGHLEEYAQE